MREKIRGLLAALLCVGVIVFGLSGCAKEQPLYTAGLLSETEVTTGSIEAQSGTDGTAIDGDTSMAAASGDASAAAEDASGSMVSASADASGGVAAAAEDASGSMVSASADASGDAASASAGNAADGSAASDDPDTLAGLGTSGDTSEAVHTEAAVTGYVYVCGAVNEAGVYPIREDMRVCDAIALAGGFSEDADDEWLNQAANVYDGQKLYVYTVEETDLMKEAGMSAEGMDGTASGTGNVSGGAGSSDENTSAGSVTASTGSSTADGTAGGSASAASSDGSDTSESSDGKVNLNTATREELMTLPGIGESKADAILAYRSEHGAFTSIEEIQNISGIKSGVFSKIKDLITV